MKAALLALLLAGATAAQAEPVVVGSKNFTESCVLGEVMAQMIEAHTDIRVERRINLGGTLVCFEALKKGAIDLYAEYTGTGWVEVLHEPGPVGDPLHTYLEVAKGYRDLWHIEWLLPFGLDNTYAIAMREAQAEKLGITTISGLKPHAGELSAGFSIEFMNRDDGWPGLQKAYDLHLQQVRALEHGLAYRAIMAGDIDLIDAYATDAKLLRYPLRTLRDDRGFFPPYNAAPIVRQDTLAAHPELRPLLERLAFRLPDDEIRRLNYRVEEDGLSFAAAAREWLAAEKLIGDAGPPPEPTRGGGFFALMASRASETMRLVIQHLGLTAIAVLLAAATAIPIGIAVTRHRAARQLALGAAGVLQTIPSLALLAFMIPLLGLDVSAAVAALFLYALLPILRNTVTGLQEVDPDLVEAARGMGLRDRQILRYVELPLALRTIMAGVRTAAVISIGVATLAAFIGAGGLGEPIVTGLYLNDVDLILTGAVPAALLAIAADIVLGRVEVWLAPRTRGA